MVDRMLSMQIQQILLAQLHTSCTLVAWLLQIMLYWLWGNVLCAGSMSFSALCSQARPAVLVAVIWVIMSGFGANLVLTQFIEQGPSVAATVLQIIPSMGLFRGMFPDGS